MSRQPTEMDRMFMRQRVETIMSDRMGITVNSVLLYFKLTKTEKLSHFIGTHEIMDGYVYPSMPNGWPEASKRFCKFELRCYGPMYGEAQIAIYPQHPNAKKLTYLTSVELQSKRWDYEADNKLFLLTQLGEIYVREVLPDFEGQVTKQLPF